MTHADLSAYAIVQTNQADTHTQVSAVRTPNARSEVIRDRTHFSAHSRNEQHFGLPQGTPLHLSKSHPVSDPSAASTWFHLTGTNVDLMGVSQSLAQTSEARRFCIQAIKLFLFTFSSLTIRKTLFLTLNVIHCNYNTCFRIPSPAAQHTSTESFPGSIYPVLFSGDRIISIIS